MTDAAIDPAPGETRTDAAIAARGLRKVYPGADGGKRALDDIDLTVPAGSIFGLLGPNGAGKSTFINILAGLVLKTAGSIRIWGFDQDANPRQSRAAIGVVPQELHFDPFLSPYEALEIQAGLYGVPKARRRSLELLRAVGLEDKAHAYARTLSGGMRRRLLVAKAMVHAPPVLVLDEPTAGVDIELRRQLWEYVRALNRQGVTIILTTHYLEEAQEMCDRIAIIHHGRVVASQPTPELLSRLESKTLIVDPGSATSDAQFGALRAALPAGVSAVARANDRIALNYARGSVAVGGILAALAEAGIGVADLTTEEADLEDVFLELTRDGD